MYLEPSTEIRGGGGIYEYVYTHTLLLYKVKTFSDAQEGNTMH